MLSTPSFVCPLVSQSAGSVGALMLSVFLCSTLPVMAHGGAGGLETMPDTTHASGPQITVYRSASCGCCTQWGEHLATAGFRIDDQVTEAMAGVKERQGIAPETSSCHTAVVEGYVIEGHVPVASIQRLLSERPAIRGLVVPGMPMGSPGMEVRGVDAESFDVMAIAHDGSLSVFDRY